MPLQKETAQLLAERMKENADKYLEEMQGIVKEVITLPNDDV